MGQPPVWKVILRLERNSCLCPQGHYKNVWSSPFNKAKVKKCPVSINR